MCTSGNEKQCLSSLPYDLKYILSIEVPKRAKKSYNASYDILDLRLEQEFSKIVYLPTSSTGFVQIQPMFSLCLSCFFSLLKRKI